MNFKKITGIALLCLLLCAAVTMSACNGSGDTPSTEAPTDAPATEAPTELPTEAPTEPAVEVNCTITIMDQDGLTIPGVSFTLSGKQTLNAVECKTDETGKCTLTLTEGEYTVSISTETLPSGYLPDDSRLTVSADVTDYVLKVSNNNPNGTADRPFPIVEETTTVTVPAGASYTYVMFNAMDRTLKIENTTLTVTYKGTDYVPDESGNISVPLTNESPRDPGYFTLVNTTDADVEATVTIESTPGSMNNPFVVESLGEDITATVPKEAMVYYKWIATKTGVLMVTCESQANHISMTNMTNSTVSYFTNGTYCEYLNVTEGDEIQISVACTKTDVDSTDIIFKLTEHAGTAEDPIPVAKPEPRFTLAAGATYVFTTDGSIGTVSIEGKDLKVTVDGQTYTSSEEGKVEITFDGNGINATVSVENTGESRQEIKVSLTAPLQP